MPMTQIRVVQRSGRLGSGGMDHLVAAMVMEAAGKDALNVKYVAYDAGGKAMAALLSRGSALSTGSKLLPCSSRRS